MGDLTEHFSRYEFACPCTNPECSGFPVEPNPELVRALEDLRVAVGLPIRITSGVRCPAHNAAVGGKPDSTHLTGKAADFAVLNSSQRWFFLERAVELFDRIGIGKTFLHVDVADDDHHVTKVIWLYGGSEGV